MQAYHFCTIATPDFLSFTTALHASLQKQRDNTWLHVLVVDREERPTGHQCIYYNLSDLEVTSAAQQMIQRYGANNDLLRWSMKSTFLLHLLQRVEAVFYADNDLHFFDDFDFLFRQLAKHSLLLSPHWATLNPWLDEEKFQMNFQIGLFNAGFIGVNQQSTPFLNWWQQACLFKMTRDMANGYYDDQRFLDAAVLLLDDVGIIRHAGCNLGSWNLEHNRRRKVGNKVVVNEEYPIVFIHFNNETIKHIAIGNDSFLQPYLKIFEHSVKTTGGNIYAAKQLAVPPARTGTFLRLKQALRLRARMKHLLYYLSQKL